MAVKGYVLIGTDVGTAKSVADQLRASKYEKATILAVDTVTGPYDVIAQLEAADLNQLGTCITEAIQTISGVSHTTTCLTIILN